MSAAPAEPDVVDVAALVGDVELPCEDRRGCGSRAMWVMRMPCSHATFLCVMHADRARKALDNCMVAGIPVGRCAVCGRLGRIADVVVEPL